MGRSGSLVGEGEPDAKAGEGGCEAATQPPLHAIGSESDDRGQTENRGWPCAPAATPVDTV